jgi:electron transfer flavoprotein beta subunit
LNTIVCIKPITNNFEDRNAGTQYSLSQYDESALEIALKLKEGVVDGSVTVLCMHYKNPLVENLLIEIYKRGVDSIIILSDKAFSGADTLATSYVLSKAIKIIGKYDLILCGRQSDDSNTGQIGASLAEWLDVPHITCVTQITNTCEMKIECKKICEDSFEKLNIKYPTVLTIEKSEQLRAFTAFTIRSARGKEIIEWNALNISADVSLCGIKGSPTKVISQKHEPVPSVIQQRIEGTIEEKASSLAEILNSYISCE